MDLVELRWLVSNLMLPPASPMLLVIAGLLLLGRLRDPGPAGTRRRWGRRVLVAGVVLGWALSTPLVAGALAAWVEGDLEALSDARLRDELASASPPGAIVILGGGMGFDERELPHQENVNEATLQRLAHGARIARVTGLPVLVSGGRPPQRQNAEAQLMARTLRESMGVEPRWIEARSRDTAGNARESAQLLGEDGVTRVVLVTQAYHIPRARAAFEAAGLEVLPAPHGFLGGGVNGNYLVGLLPSANAVKRSWLALHEVLGIAWYRLRGRA